MKRIELLIIGCFIVASLCGQTGTDTVGRKVDSFNQHAVILNDQSKIISWTTPQSGACDWFLRQRRNFIKTIFPCSTIRKQLLF